ncbi:MAG: hypothetical protein MUE85_06965 [Microscillaceae bacterium]|jgi:hypothetical protein|nr:hypothetical protein [Microscillaceae bacterium]
MNRILLAILIYVGLSQSAFAQSQLRYLSETNAQKVVKFLKYEKELVLYYNCGDQSKDVARRLKIDKVSYVPADRAGYFEVLLEGTVVATFDVENQMPINYFKTEEKFAEVVDIAYVHIRAGGYLDSMSGKTIWDATCLGIYLGFDCDPCIDPFDYPSQVI